MVSESVLRPVSMSNLSLVCITGLRARPIDGSRSIAALRFELVIRASRRRGFARHAAERFRAAQPPGEKTRRAPRCQFLDQKGAVAGGGEATLRGALFFSPLFLFDGATNTKIFFCASSALLFPPVVSHLFSMCLILRENSRN